MAAAPAAPAAPGAPGAPVPFTFPREMIDTLIDVGALLDAGDLPQAKSRFAILTGIPKKLDREITALFKEVEEAPKTASAADPLANFSGYRLRVAHLIEQAQKAERVFRDALPETFGYDGFFSHLLVFSMRLNGRAVMFLKQTEEVNDYRSFLKAYYIAMNRFFTNGETAPAVSVVNSYCLEIAKLPHKKRVTYHKDIMGKKAVEAGGKDFLTLVTNFQIAMSDPESITRIMQSQFDHQADTVAGLALAGYGHLQQLEGAVADFNKILIHMKGLNIIFQVDHLLHLQTILKSQLDSRYSTRVYIKTWELHLSTMKRSLEIEEELSGFYTRHLQLYRPILHHPDFKFLIYNLSWSEKTITYLHKNEELLNEFLHFVKAVRKRVDLHLPYLISQLKTLLDLHTWMMSDNPREWQTENQHFNQLVAGLPQRLRNLDTSAMKRIGAAVSVDPISAAYRSFLKNKLQSLIEFQAALNGMFTLYMHDIDKIQLLRSPKNLLNRNSWNTLEPYTKYRAVRLPTGEMLPLKTAEDLGLKPPKQIFDFLSPMKHSDIPFLKLLLNDSAATPILTASVKICLLLLDKEPANGSVLAFPEVVVPKLPPKEIVHVEDPCDGDDEEEVKEAAAATPCPPVLPPVPVIYQIRDLLLAKMTQAKETATGVVVKKVLTQAETQLRALFALAHSFEQHLHYRGMMHAQVFHACVTVVETANLLFEQLSQAIHLQANPVTDIDSVVFTHNIKKLIEENLSLMSYLNIEEYQFLMDVSRAGFDTRDIAFLVQEGRSDTASQRLLTEAFHHHTASEPRPLASLLANFCDYCSNTFKTMVTLLDYFANPSIKATRPKELSTLSTQWQRNLNANRDVKTDEPSPATKTHAPIAAISTFILKLRRPELLGGVDYAPLFDNLLLNKLSRLQTEIENQSILNRDELAVHLATVLNLTHLIAADVLYIHLLSLAHQGHSVVIPETRSLIDLVASHNGRELPELLRIFVHTPLRNVARYAETADQKRSDKKTATAAKRMRRAIAHSAAAAPTAPAAPEAIAMKEADLKAGFEEVEPRVIVETKELAMKHIERLWELINWVCVAPKKLV